MSAADPLKCRREHDGAVLRLTLDAPPANVLDATMIGALQRALTGLEEDRRLKAIVFDATGRHFCYGASVEEHTAARAAGMLERFHGLFRRLAQLCVPTCALVRGRCLGGGMELASWCTWVVAEPDAELAQPEIKLGVLPPIASLLLPWRAGGRAALDLCVSGRAIDAETAREMGLLTEVDADPETWWSSWFAEHLAPLSASSLRFAERAARRTLLTALEHELPVLERLYLDELMATHDANEGLASFLERRHPRWEANR